jgi:hypothetical protein
MAAGLAFASVSTFGCGGGGSGKTATVVPGNMPDGQSWTGVYFHEVYGYLHLVEQDNNIVTGRWLRKDESASGDIHGTKVGNVLHFTWSEAKCGGAGLSGPAFNSHGKGVFVYKMNKEGIAELDGQYGLNDDETGSDWHNVKQQRRDPEVDTAKCKSPGGGGTSAGFE